METNGYSLVTPENVTMINAEEIKTASPFKDLFPIKRSEFDKIEKNMRECGYDSSHPIVVWKGHGATVIDGHTRLAVANKLMFQYIPVILREFKDEAEALEYAINSQVNRRNLTDSELMTCLNELDKRNPKGGNENTKASHVASGKTAEKTASLLGISRAKVERLRAINDHASPEMKEAVKQGKISANKAYNATMSARRATLETEKAVMGDENTKDQFDGIRLERLTLLRKSIRGSLEKRIERELQEFPELRYTAEELASVIDDAKTAIEDNINKLIEKEY